MDQYVHKLLSEDNYNYHRKPTYGANQNNKTDAHNSPGFVSRSWSKLKNFIKEHPFITIFIGFILAIVIGVMVYIVVFIDNRRKDEKKEKFKEKFKATNNINDEFEYVNSYINSVLGNSDDMASIDENASPV